MCVFFFKKKNSLAPQLGCRSIWIFLFFFILAHYDLYEMPTGMVCTLHTTLFQISYKMSHKIIVTLFSQP